MNTILGNISPSALGRTLPHEHILVGSAEMPAAFGDRRIDRKKLVELAVKEVEVVRDRYGISTIIDGTATDTFRDLEIIREVSLRTTQKALTICGRTSPASAVYFLID